MTTFATRELRFTFVGIDEASQIPSRSTRGIFTLGSAMPKDDPIPLRYTDWLAILVTYPTTGSRTLM